MGNFAACRYVRLPSDSESSSVVPKPGIELVIKCVEPAATGAASREPLHNLANRRRGVLDRPSDLPVTSFGIIARRQLAGAPHEVLLVIDGSTGMNALNQAREFHKAVPLTGLIVTKLDGTSKGGMVVAIQKELGLPIKFIGLGEQPDDLQPFDAKQFAQALFEE